MDKLQRQKEELRLQYAREIEAAQAQLGENEAQLGYEHLQALQQLRDENKQGTCDVCAHHCHHSVLCVAAIDAKRDREAAVSELQGQMESEKEEELKKLKQRMEDEISQLRSILSDKSSELDLAQEQLKRLEYELAKKEQGMGSVTSSMEELRAELVNIQGELVVSRKEREAALKEKVKLVVSIPAWHANEH